MKEIGKAEFVRRVTGGKSLFIGISTVMNDREIKAAKNVRLKMLEAKAKTRSCVVKSNNHLVFGGESHLELKDVKPHTVVKCYATDDNILVVENKWIDTDWNGNVIGTRYKYLYYSME